MLPWWGILLIKLALSAVDLNKVARWALAKQEEQRKRDAASPPPPPDTDSPFGGPE